MWPHDLTKEEDIAWEMGAGRWQEGSGGGALSRQRIFMVFTQKKSFQHIFLSKKDIPIPEVSAVVVVVVVIVVSFISAIN